MSGANVDLTTICQIRGWKEVSKPEKITVQNQKEVLALDEIAQLLEVYKSIKDIDFSKLPDKAIKPLREITGRCHSPQSLCFDFAISLIIDTLNVENFEGEDKAAIDSLLEDLKVVKKTYLRLFDKTNPSVSPAVRDRYIQVEKGIQKGALHKRALKALKIVIEEKALGLPKGTRAKLGINGGDWVEKFNMEKITVLIGEMCAPGVVVKKQEKPEQKPSGPPILTYSLRGGAGYGHRVKGDNHPQMLAGEAKGVAAQSAASGNFRLADGYGLQIDYRFAAPYDVIGDDNIVSNDDLGLISFISQPADSVDLFVQAGWRYYRNDHPSDVTSNLNALMQKARVNWIPSSELPNLAINFDENLMAGWTGDTFPNKEGEFDFIRAAGEAGVSYQFLEDFGSFILFGGGIGGYGMDEAIYGGYAGLGYILDEHEAHLKLQYRKDMGLGVSARYFYNEYRWGIGGRVFYDLNLEETHHLVTGEINARFKLTRFWGNDLELQPFANVASEINSSDSAVNVGGGLILRFGVLLPAILTDLNYTTRPFKEEW